jgi:predicted aspartyl protease
MQLLLEHDLPFITVEIAFQGVVLEVPRVIVDTGSATTLLSVDYVEQAGITPEASDQIRNVYGVGGIESVFRRRLDRLRVGPRTIDDFNVDVGGMDYARDINGILGMNFLLRAGAVIDLRQLTMEVDMLGL